MKVLNNGCWNTRGRCRAQRGRHTLALQPLRRHGLLLCLMLMWAHHANASPDEALAQPHRAGEYFNYLSHGASAQHLHEEGRPQRSLQNQQFDNNAVLPRLLASASKSVDDNSSSVTLENQSDNGGVLLPGSRPPVYGSRAISLGSVDVGGGASGSGTNIESGDFGSCARDTDDCYLASSGSSSTTTTPPVTINTEDGAAGQARGSDDGDGDSSPAPVPLSPPQRPPPGQTQSQPQPPQCLLCSHDRVTAPETGGSCGPHRAVVDFAVVIVTVAGGGGGGGDGSMPVKKASSAAGIVDGGGAANSTRMCANPAAFSPETGILNMSICWRPGDHPDQLLATAAAAAAAAAANASTAVLRITLPQLSLYGVPSMPPGNYSVTVNGADAFGVVVQPAAGGSAGAATVVIADAVSSPSAPLTVVVPAGGASSVTLWFDLTACDADAAGLNATAGGGAAADVNGTAGVSGGAAVAVGSVRVNISSNASTSSAMGIGCSSGSGNKTRVVGITDLRNVASRILSFSLAGPPSPLPAASTCKCAAAPAAAAAAVLAAATATAAAYQSPSVCTAGLIPLVSTVIPVGDSRRANVTVGGNGNNSINGTSGGVTSGGAGGEDRGDAFVDEDGDGGGGGSRFVQCVPQPMYDNVSRRFTFSICWRYACLPVAFARRPYELLLGPVSYTAATAPPVGSYKMSTSLPGGVNLSYEYAAAATPVGPWTVLAVAAGGGSSAGGTDLLRLPPLAAGQIRIRIQIPFDMNVDDSGGFLELKLIPSPMTSGFGSGTGTSSSNSGGGSGGGGGSVVLQAADGSAMTPPPLPSAAAASANATLSAVSELWLPRRISSGGGGGGGGGVYNSALELADMLRRGMGKEAAASGGQPSNVSASVEVLGFRLTLPLQFRDFTSVSDCGADSLAALRARAEAALAAPGGNGDAAESAATVTSVGCSYDAYSGGRRRLQQQTCTPRLNAPLSVDTPALDLDAFLSYSTASLSTVYGGSMCSLDPASSDILVTSKLAVSIVMPAALVTSSAVSSAAASTSACTAGAQLLASSLGLGTGEAMVVSCQLSAQAPPDAVPQSGVGATPLPAPGSGGDGAGKGGGGAGAGAHRIAIIIASAGAGTALAAAVLVVVFVRHRRRRRRSSRFLSSEASTGRRTFDSISTMSITESVTVVTVLAAGSADSARFADVAAPLTNGKRRRRGFDGPTSGGAACGLNESEGAAPSSSKSLGTSSYRARGFSYTCKTGSPRPPVYDHETNGGAATGAAAGGMEAGFMAMVAPPATAGMGAAGGAAGASNPSRSQRRRSTNGIIVGMVGGADRVFRRGAFKWPLHKSPGCTNDSDDGDDGSCGGGDGGSCPGSAPATLGGPFSSPLGDAVQGGARRLLGTSRNAGAAGCWYDFFGLDDGIVAGADLAAPAAAAAVYGAVPSDLAARPRSMDSVGHRCSSAHALLRRSNGGNLALDPLPPPPCESDGDGAADGDGDGQRTSVLVRTSVPLERHTAPASMALLPSPRSPLSPWSPCRTLQPPLHRHLHIGLPGIAEWHLPGSEWPGGVGGGGGVQVNDELPYGDDPLALCGGGGGNVSAPGGFGLETDERDLLRVQSRRPAFLDRTGGSLAAAVAATVSMPYSTAVAVASGVAGCAPLHRGTPRDASTRVEPRRGGFIHRNSVAPYPGSEPSSYTPYIPAQPGTVPAAAIGAPGACYEAWSPSGSTACSSPRSPGSSFAAMLAGVIGGRRRSSGCGGGAVGASRLSTSGAEAASSQHFASARSQSPLSPPPPPPPSPSSAAAAPQWLGGLSRRTRPTWPRDPTGGDSCADDGGGGGGGIGNGSDWKPSAPPGGGRGGGLAGFDVGASLNLELSYTPSKVRQPPRKPTSGGLDPGQRPESSSGLSSSCAANGDGSGGGGDGGGEAASAIVTGERRPMGRWPSPGRSPLAPKRMPALLHLPAVAAGDGEEEEEGPTGHSKMTLTSLSNRPATTVSVSRFATAAYNTAPVLHCGSGNGGNSGGNSSAYMYGSGSGSASGDRGLEELSPAFGPTAAMRARQLYKRSSSCGSSNGAVPYGMGGLVDPDVEANAESGAARLAMMKRLAVGPPRPAWGLIHAGVGPIKRSIASVQYAKSLNTRAASPAARASAASPSPSGSQPSAVAASPAAAAALAVAAGGGYGGCGKRGSVPGVLLSCSGSHEGGVPSSRSSSREVLGPFLRLLE